MVFSEKFQCHHDCVLTCRFTTAVCGKFSPRWLRIWRRTSTSTSKDGWILCQTSLHHVWTTRHGHDSSSYSHPKVGTTELWQMVPGHFNPLHAKFFKRRHEHIFIPPEQRSCWGVYWFHSVRLSVRLSVRPSVCPGCRVRSVTSTVLDGFFPY